MSERFIKYFPSEEAEFLQMNHPGAFLLLTLIAKRARRENGKPDGLTIGQCHIGDYKKAGLTRQQYRTAIEILVKRQHIKKVETCRTRQKSTTGTTTVGTLVELISLTVYDINSEATNHPINHRPTTDQPPTNHEQERIRKNKNKKKNKQKKEIIEIPEAELFAEGKFFKVRKSEYEQFCLKHGKVIIDELIETLNDHCSNNRPEGYLDYAAGLRTFIKNRSKYNSKPGFVVKKEDNRQKVLERLKHGAFYNGAECFIDENAVALSRGMNHVQVKFTENGFWDQFDNMLRRFGVEKNV